MSQNHGFIFEDIMHIGHNGVSKEEYDRVNPEGYIAPFDITSGVLSDFNGSVKTAKTNSGIACGDILRMFKHTKNEDIRFIIGVWDQISKTKKKVHTIYEFYLTPEHHKSLWGNFEQSMIEEYVDYVKSIPAGKQSQLDNNSIYKAKVKHIYEVYGKPIMKINTKIDSKKQRRVQCSFSIDNLIDIGIPYNKYEDGYPTEYNNIKLPLLLNSESRKFNNA